MICKLQRPISGDEGPILVYSRDRTTINMAVPWSTALAKLFQDRYEVYAEASLGTDGLLAVKKVVRDQAW